MRDGRARYFTTFVESPYCHSSQTRMAGMPYEAYVTAVRGLLSMAT